MSWGAVGGKEGPGDRVGESMKKKAKLLSKHQ
jgi:hypothetical protein